MTARPFALHLFSAALLLVAPGLRAQTEQSAATAHRLMVRSGLAVQQPYRPGRGHPAEHGHFDQSGVELVESSRPSSPRCCSRTLPRVAKKLTVGDAEGRARVARHGCRRADHACRGGCLRLDGRHPSGRIAHRLQTKPLPAERQKLISDLIAATGAVRVAASVAETMALGIALGMDSLQPQERRVGGLRAHIGKAMPADKLQAVFAQQLPISYAYTYREISDADLAAYVGFRRRNRQALPGGMNAAFTEGLRGRACSSGIGPRPTLDLGKRSQRGR